MAPVTFSRVLKACAVALGALLLAAVLWLAARIVFYRQVDDPQRLEGKREYLARVAELTGGSLRGPNVVLILFDDLGYGELGA